jgi:spore germination protein GerM
MQGLLPSRTVVLALLALLAPAVAGVLAGCGEGGAGQGLGSTTTAGNSTTESPGAAEYGVYFPTADGEHIVKVQMPGSGQAGNPLEGALSALAAGPDRSGLAPALPAGTRVLGVTSRGGTARIDLSSRFAEAYPSGGSAAEIAALAPIVFTATEIEGVRDVLLTVGGATPDVPTQFDLGAPLARDDFPPDIVAAAR